jgi:ribosomal protein S18 acetylase RimI-like enzyme
MADVARSAAARNAAGSVFCRTIGGGVAVYVRDGSPCNKWAGLGFDRPPSDADIDDVEREFDRRHVPVRVEFASLGDPEIATRLTRRGYELIGFENVMALPLDGTSVARLPEKAANTPIAIAPADSRDASAWADVLVTGFLNPDVFDGPPPTEEFDRAAIEQALDDIAATTGFEPFVARRDGTVAGAGALRLCEGLAQLCGAATLPEHRRQGVQSTLLRARLQSAASRGCDLAVVTTQPGSKSQENVQRAGFSLLYTRAILVRPAR